ncbi:hypothetical protein BN946_scf184908.g134 [Trametes cinnabarina]|uniref:HMG box domain-containing protein n=1 Tax=Pycnoporus cinnabarinus TaxID=5643 RepID=A0A060SAZ6_PYCCI|nr:hypothetical protein BN946_scf184908.g134 [Trametes cinnabarina]
MHLLITKSGQNTSSPFSPSTSPGATSQQSSDSEWSSEWSLGTPAPPSRTTTPALNAGRSTPHVGVTLTQEQFEAVAKFLAAWQGETVSDCPSTSSSPAVQSSPAFHPVEQPSASRPSTPKNAKHNRVPRPPNAFMLYRSHLLKTGQIPPVVEHRQQNISRVAGEAWNMLPDAEKNKWHAKAKEVLTAHMAKHPDYKFSPERKSTRRKTTQDPEVPAPDGKDYIRFLREKYVGLKGPAVSPPRPRKPKSRRGIDASRRAPMSLPPSLESSPASSPASARIPSAPPSLSSSPAPQHSVPHFDLAMFQNYDFSGFQGAPGPSQSPAQYASHTAHSGPFDDDITPKASTFGEISLPPHPKYNFLPNLSYPSCNSTSESHLGLNTLALPGSSQSSSSDVPCQSQPSAFDPMWDTLMHEPFGHPGSDGSGSSAHEDDNTSPFASAELSGPIDFDSLHFPSLFPGSE